MRTPALPPAHVPVDPPGRCASWMSARLKLGEVQQPPRRPLAVGRGGTLFEQDVEGVEWLPSHSPYH